MEFKMQRTIKKDATLELDYKDDFDNIDGDQLDDMFFDSEFMLFNGNKLNKI